MRLGPVEAEANYFYTAYDDLIVYLLQSGFRFRPYNVGRATAQGVEVSGSVRVGTVARLHANWTYADVVDRGRDASWRGRQVPGKPRNQVFFRTEFTLDPVIPYAEYHFVGKNPVTRANTKLLDARHLVQAGVRWKATPALSLEIAARNLTDARAVDVRGFPLPSRAVYLGITLDW